MGKGCRKFSNRCRKEGNTLRPRAPARGGATPMGCVRSHTEQLGCSSSYLGALIDRADISIKWMHACACMGPVGSRRFGRGSTSSAELLLRSAPTAVLRPQCWSAPTQLALSRPCS